MQRKLETQILSLIEKLKQEGKKINGQEEIKAIRDVRFIQNVKIDGKQKDIICTVLSNGKDEEGKEIVIYKYYMDNEFICVVDPIHSNEPIFNDPTVKQKLLLVILNPEKFGKEEVSLEDQIKEDEKFILKVAKELGISREELKRLALLDSKQEVDNDEKKNENKKELELHEDDFNLKQNLKLNSKVNEMKTLGQTLKLPSEYERIAVVESYEMSKIDGESNATTRYCFVGITKDGIVKKLDTLEQDMSVGNNSTQEEYKVMHDGDIEDSMVLSRYTIDGTNATLSIRNGEAGQIEVFYSPEKTREGNESFDKQLETDNIWPISTEIRKVVGEYNKEGIYATDEAYDKAEEAKKDEDFDGHNTTDVYAVDEDKETRRDIQNEEDETSKDEVYDEPIKKENEPEYYGPDDEFEGTDGRITTLRREAEKDGYNNLDEYINKFNRQPGNTPGEKLENLRDEINRDFIGGNRTLGV